VARPAPPSDDGSPARLIATMVGIVGILLLGSLAWSAVGALVTAVGSAGQALTPSRPPATLEPAVAVTPTLIVALVTTPTIGPTLAVATAEPSPASPTEMPATPTPEAAKRNPWVLLPLPEPNAQVSPGPVTIEARGRGDVPITAIRLDLDGASLPVAIEQRSESTWRGSARAQVSAGQHAVRATVTDAEGRTGSFRWSFAAGP
jgi:hypothetical protein